VRVRDGAEIRTADLLETTTFTPSATNTVKTGVRNKTAGHHDAQWQYNRVRVTRWMISLHCSAPCRHVTVGQTWYSPGNSVPGGSTTCVTALGQICRLRVKRPTSSLIHFRPTTDRISGYWPRKRSNICAKISCLCTNPTRQLYCLIGVSFYKCVGFILVCVFLQCSCNAAIFLINSSSFQLLVVMIVKEKNLAQETPVYQTSLMSHMGKIMIAVILKRLKSQVEPFVAE